MSLDLLDSRFQTFYLTRLPNNAHVKKNSNGLNLYCSAHIFLILDQHAVTDILNCSKAEVQAYRWVPFKIFYRLIFI